MTVHCPICDAHVSVPVLPVQTTISPGPPWQLTVRAEFDAIFAHIDAHAQEPTL